MTSRPAPSKRPSTVAELVPRPPCKIHSLAVVSDKAQITGTYPVEIGENTVLHPYARIRAEHGKVVIGKNCAVSEKAVVGTGETGEGDVVIGDGVNIETGAVVEAKSVGNGTTIEVNAIVGKAAVLGQHCKISPLNTIMAGEELADYTVVYGDDRRIRDHTMASNPEVREAKQKGQMMHIQLLHRLIPNAAAKWTVS